MKWTDEQRRAITTIDGDLCVDAGAGSGKTSVLIERILFLLDNNLAGLDDIVAITFTDKAAGEIKQRLRAECHRRAPEHDPQQLTRWRQMERQVGAARISTIHAFCMGLLKTHALGLQRDPELAVLSEPQVHQLRLEIVETTLHELLESGHEAAYRLACEYGFRETQKKLVELLKNRGTADHVFSTAPISSPDTLRHWWETVAKEEHERRVELLRTDSGLESIRTRLRALDGCCTKPDDKREQLRIELLAALESLRTAPDMNHAMKIAEQTLTLKAAVGKKQFWQSEDAYENVKDCLDELRKRLPKLMPPPLNVETEQRAAELTCGLASVYRQICDAYQNAKIRRGACDFDDQILDATRMFRECPEVRARVARGINYLLVDEFQDTDSTQYELVELLTKEPGGPSLFIVGDMKQSIYYFRGAEVEVFQTARTAVQTTIPLVRNFRAAPDVLEFVNDFFAKTNLLDAVEQDYAGLDADRRSCGERRIEFIIPEEREKCNVNEYREIEAAMLAQRLAAMCFGPHRVNVWDRASDAARPARFGDAALLFRSMSDVYVYEKALKDLGIPYYIVSGRGFFQCQEIMDVRNLLAAVADPWDEAALLGFLRSPMAGLSDESIFRLSLDSSLAQSFYNNSTPASFAQPVELDQARRLLAQLRTRRDTPLAALMQYALDETAYEAILQAQYLGEQKAQNVRKLADLADQFGRADRPHLAAFVRYMDELTLLELREGEAPLETEGADVVTLMTVHKAKGLEFPIVFVPDLSRKLAPKSASVTLDRQWGMALKVTDATGETSHSFMGWMITDIQRNRERAEHARILYVAMTRARDWLVLSGAPKAEPDSWMKAFDSAYGILARQDGDAFAGTGWQAVVQRDNRPENVMISIRSMQEQLPDVTKLLSDAAPLSPCAYEQRHFAVTALARIMRSMGHEPSCPAAAISEKSSDETATSRDRGEMVHRFLETWDFVSPSEAHINAVLKEFRCLPETVGVHTRDMTDVADRLRGSTLGTRIANDGGAMREIAFMLRLDHAILDGAIDMVLSDGTIVDYKTGQAEPGLHEQYEWQVRLYAAAVESLRGVCPPQAFLWYVDADEAVEIDVRPARLRETLDLVRRAVSWPSRP